MSLLRRASPVDGGNLGGDFWPHPWAEELAKSDKGDSLSFEDVVAHFNVLREKEGLEPLEEGSSPLVILEGIVTNSQDSGQGVSCVWSHRSYEAMYVKALNKVLEQWFEDA